MDAGLVHLLLDGALLLGPYATDLGFLREGALAFSSTMSSFSTNPLDLSSLTDSKVKLCF